MENDFEAEVKEAMEPIIDILIEEYETFSPPPGLLIPEKVWRSNIRQELTDACTGKEIQKRMNSAQTTILEDVQRHLSSAEFQHFQEEWQTGVEKILALDPSTLPDEGSMPPSLQSIMGVSEEVFEHLYQVGLRCYNAKEYQKAADVFFFITIIDYLRFNNWVSLGLSEKQNKHWEVALSSFNMASLIHPENPVPYLQCAECCLCA